LKNKTPLRFNPGDTQLLQKLLPLFSPDVTRINDLVGFVSRNGTVCYFNYQMPIYHHGEDDMASFKVFVCQLVLNGNATPWQIKRAFGLTGRQLNRWLKQYRQQGPAAFYGKSCQIRPKGGRDIRPLWTQAGKWLRSISHFRLKLKKKLS
jgi:hypothetical protein